MEGYVTGMLRKVELFVKNECGDVENGISTIWRVNGFTDATRVIMDDSDLS
jgi:hypothetical protein